MASGPIGSCWDTSDTWVTTGWQANTWSSLGTSASLGFPGWIGTLLHEFRVTHALYTNAQLQTYLRSHYGSVQGMGTLLARLVRTRT